ncbi:MAG TPA: hypothetical protein VFO54_05530 [Chryseosolibacter sp.]|nr:hypothetical protein [Chryseosolibacter sp.]
MESALNNNSGTPLVGQRTASAFSTDVGYFKSIKRVWTRLTQWETWDWRIKYIIIFPAWLWFCFRARSFWFFTASNPSLTFGGFDGESKREMYAQLPPGSYPKSIYVSCHQSIDEVRALIFEHGFEFPFAVKPDVGKMGFMFRRISTPADLQNYHEKIDCDYIIQDLVSLPLEVSVFYFRLPHQERGTISGFIRKDFLEVTGDGKSTLWQLILDYSRVQFRIEEMKAKHKDKLHHILRSGEKYCLSPALNLSRGGKLVSLEQEKDDRLLKVFDNISHYAGNFYYGRYDIKCQSIEDLKQGRNFLILEYNGSGAEPHHVYGNGYNLWQACSILVGHWAMLHRISRVNHERGVLYWNFRRGLNFLRNSAKHLKRLKQLDSETLI